MNQSVSGIIDNLSEALCKNTGYKIAKVSGFTFLYNEDGTLTFYSTENDRVKITLELEDGGTT